jgi:hypothetical protein
VRAVVFVTGEGLMKTRIRLLPFTVGTVLRVVAASSVRLQGGDDPNPPAEIVKLIFIHHSSGKNRCFYFGLI